jgi:hypothetical protein
VSNLQGPVRLPLLAAPLPIGELLPTGYDIWRSFPYAHLIVQSTLIITNAALIMDVDPRTGRSRQGSDTAAICAIYQIVHALEVGHRVRCTPHRRTLRS